MMLGRLLGVIVALIAVHTAQGQNPPVIQESFIAWGEIVQPVPDTNNLIVLQTSFEESYDANTKNAAFFLYLSGKNLTFVKNYASNQTFLYIETNKEVSVTYEATNMTEKKVVSKIQCSEASEQQWMESDFAPGLLSFEDDDGTIKFSLTQLLNIPNKYMTDQLRGVSTTYRGIPAKSWMYVIKTKSQDSNYEVTLSIQSYWSDGKWNTSAGQRMTPLGFNISKSTWSKPLVVEDYVINVFGFVPDAYDHKYFEPVQGVVCASKKNTLKFPIVKDIQAISFHSEMALPDYQELRYIDTWFDPVNQFIRIDVERLKDEDPMESKQKRYQSEIAIGQMGVVYRFGTFKGESGCEVIPFDKYENDLQNLFDIKQDLYRWKMGKIFGLNDTTYVYIGQTTKNNIPCHLFQGMRTDWPDKESNMQSLWEWCFNINMTNKNDVVLFQADEFGLISANVIILSDPKDIFTNYRMNYHFYKVKAQDPKLLDATRFDIGKCFKDTEKRAIQFYLTIGVGRDNKYMIANATSDITFLQRWKDAIYKYTGLPDYSLRISNLRATVVDDKVYIKFSILTIHKDLPKAMKDKQMTAFDAEKTLRDNINDGKVSIFYQLQKGKLTTMVAAKHSVSFQIDPRFEPQTIAPLPVTTSATTKFVFTLRTEPNNDKSSTTTSRTPSGNTDNPDVTRSSDSGEKSSKPDERTTTRMPDKEIKTIVNYVGHQPGTVAGVSIAMLLIGVSIGAGGTFYKFSGLPQCMRR